MNELPVTQAMTEQDAANHWWENFFKTSPDAQIVCRRDGIVERINPRAAHRFELGAFASDGIFSVLQLLSDPSDQKLAQILQADRSGVDTLYSVNARGDGMPVALMDLEITRLDHDFNLVTFKDSSRRQRLESHVQRLVTAIDAMPDGFLVTDAELRIIYVNPAFQSATGYGLEEILGRSDEFLRAPSARDKIQDYCENARLGREWIGELINVRRNGEIYPVEATISPIADIAGRFMGYVACERDITVRRQLQTALRIERDFAQSILQSLDGAIYSLDCEFRLTHTNEGWRRLPAEHGGICFNGVPVIGRPLLDSVSDPVRRGELRLAFEKVISTGGPQENEFKSPDGRYWLMRISPWKDGATMYGLICNLVDHTHYHKLQNQHLLTQKKSADRKTRRKLAR
jgi:PAS domain S-box-containing protein